MNAPVVAKIPQGKLKILNIEDIKWDKRYREEFGNLDDLADSIREKGVLQPITVGADMVLLAGERRLKASLKAGLKQIPALVRETEGEIDAREVELMENVFRKDFTWAEECALVQEIDRLYKSKNMDWSGRKTAALLNRSVAGVSRQLQLARAIEHLPELAEHKTADEALKILKKMEEDVIVDELRKRQEHHINDAIKGGSKHADFGLAQMMKIADGNYNIGDTFKGMAELRSNGVVNIIECDPPYGIALNEVKASKDTVTSNVHTYNEVATDAYPAFLKRLCTELYRVAGQHCWLVFWFGPTWQHEVLTALRDAGWHVDEIPAVWVKQQGQTLQPELYFARAYEPFYLCRKGNPVMVKRGRLNVFNVPGEAGAKKYHPTQRPLTLIQEILETLGTPMSTVFVPFLGSGATLRAAYNCGMTAFGYDLSGEYKDKFMLAVEGDVRALNGAAAGDDDEDDGDE